mmetsp:Transcript_85609/g.178854  ORF Transcript_85609/g.178854 Transcript_85609/m.178854 type:complete len:251 (+) Transcript_85609:387-1139(+)
MPGFKKFLDPIWNLRPLVLPRITLVGEHHDPVVSLGADDASQALRSLPHRVEVQELGLLDAVVFFEKLKPCSKVPRKGILKRNPEDDDTAAVVSVKIDTLCNFTSCDTDENCALTVVAGLPIQAQGYFSIPVVLRLQKHQLVLRDSAQHSCFAPLVDHLLHVSERWKETNNSIWHSLHHLLKQFSVVSQNSRVLSQREARGDRHLVWSMSHDQRTQTLAFHCNGKASCRHNIRHSQDFWVHFERGNGTRC